MEDQNHTPNHMDKSALFSYKDIEGKQGNDIEKFDAVSRYIPLAQDKDLVKSLQQIQGQLNTEREAKNTNHEGKIWLNNRNISENVKEQKYSSYKAHTSQQNALLKKAKSKAKAEYKKSPDSLEKTFEKNSTDKSAKIKGLKTLRTKTTKTQESCKDTLSRLKQEFKGANDNKKLEDLRNVKSQTNEITKSVENINKEFTEKMK